MSRPLGIILLGLIALSSIPALLWARTLRVAQDGSEVENTRRIQQGPIPHREDRPGIACSPVR